MTTANVVIGGAIFQWVQLKTSLEARDGLSPSAWLSEPAHITGLASSRETVVATASGAPLSPQILRKDQETQLQLVRKDQEIQREKQEAQMQLAKKDVEVAQLKAEKQTTVRECDKPPGPHAFVMRRATLRLCHAL